MRRQVEARLGLKAVDIYGLSEGMGPGVGCECVEAQAGLHGWEDHFIFEVIDQDSGKPLKEGETGELVISGADVQQLTDILAGRVPASEPE